MPKVLIVYDSKTGNTEKMARAVGEGAREEKVDVDIRMAEKIDVKTLEEFDGIVLGSPTYFGVMSEKVKGFIDRSVEIRGKLENKVGAVFTSSLSVSGGNETTLISMIQAMLIHGMVIIGDPVETGGHYGAVAIGDPDEKSLEVCVKLGRRVAKFVKKLA